MFGLTIFNACRAAVRVVYISLDPVYFMRAPLTAVGSSAFCAVYKSRKQVRRVVVFAFGSVAFYDFLRLQVCLVRYDRLVVGRFYKLAVMVKISDRKSVV